MTVRLASVRAEILFINDDNPATSLGSNVYPFDPSCTKSMAQPTLLETMTGRTLAIASLTTNPHVSLVLARTKRWPARRRVEVPQSSEPRADIQRVQVSPVQHWSPPNPKEQIPSRANPNSALRFRSQLRNSPSPTIQRFHSISLRPPTPHLCPA